MKREKRFKIDCIIILKVVLLFILNSNICAGEETPIGKIIIEDPSDPKLVINAKINNKRTLLEWNTFLPYRIIFSKSAERVGLRTFQAENKKYYKTEPVFLDIGKAKESFIDFIVLDPPFTPTVEGFIGVFDFIGEVVEIDWENRNISLSTFSEKMKNDWITYNIDCSLGFLSILCKTPSGEKKRIGISTGDPIGIFIGGAAWADWQNENVGIGKTVETYFSAQNGFQAREVFLSNYLIDEKLRFNNIIISKNSDQYLLNNKVEILLGLQSLSCYRVIIDLMRMKMHFKKNEGEPATSYEYPYSMIGATFVPESMESNICKCFVLDESPAAKAGLKDGDVLVAIDGNNIDDWKTNQETRKTMKFSGKSGKEMILKIEREGEVMKKKVELVDLLR